MQEGRPLAYASQALTDPETRYATIKKKWDIKHTPTSPFNSKANNGKVEQLSSTTNVSATRLLKAVTISTWGFLPSAKFCPSGRGGGETRLLLERDQKRDQAKSKALELFSQYFVVSSRA